MTVTSPGETVIRMRDFGPRMRTGIRAQQVHDRISHALRTSSHVRLDFADVESVGETFLDRSLGALVARHGSTILESLVFAHCCPRVAAIIGKVLPGVGPIRGLPAPVRVVGRAFPVAETHR